jgi:hypothetical protein
VTRLISVEPRRRRNPFLSFPYVIVGLGGMVRSTGRCFFERVSNVLGAGAQSGEEGDF